MKISPVVGIPTIPNPSATGLSADKLAAIKAIAANQPPPEAEPVENETVQLGQPTTSATQRIKMNVNRSTTMPIEQPAPVEENAPPLEAKTEAVAEPQVVDSDTSVQAQPVPAVSRQISPELAALAKERRALQVKERELLDKEKALQNGPTVESLIQKLKSSPLSVLQEHGVTYDQLTNEILASQGNPPQQDLKSFKDDLLKTIDEKLAGKDSQQEEAVYNYMSLEVDKLSNLVPYKFIKAKNAQGKVMELVKRMWKEEGEILTETEAMDLIETELRDEAKTYAQLMGELEPTEAPAETPQVQATGQKSIKTLTNKDSARPPLNRKQRALAAFLGQK